MAGSQLHAVGRQGVLDPQLGGVGMLGALEDGGSADLEGSAAGGNDQVHVGVAIVHDLGNAVMQEADADDALAGAHVLGGPEPNLVYTSMFLSRSTRYWIPASWPYIWIMVLTTSLAVPAVL